MPQTFETVPRRIFLDSCTAQTLGDYGHYIFGEDPLDENDRIHRVTNGFDNVEALRKLFVVTDRAMFEWIVSAESLREASAKRDRGHMQWMWDIADHSAVCLNEDGSTAESQILASRLAERRFGYLGEGDRRLLQDALALRCDSFLTVEQRLPKNAAHIERETGLRILTPVTHWNLLEPWAGLWL